MNSVGLSTSLLRVIERRQRMDQIIVYGGMVSSCSLQCCQMPHAYVLLKVLSCGV